MLRTATVLHRLFHVEVGDEKLPSILSDKAVSAAIDFVKLSCQQTAHLVGRGNLEDEIQKHLNGECSLLILDYEFVI